MPLKRIPPTSQAQVLLYVTKNTSTHKSVSPKDISNVTQRPKISLIEYNQGHFVIFIFKMKRQCKYFKNKRTKNMISFLK